MLRPIGNAGNIKCAPILIERNPNYDRRRADMLVYHHLKFITELLTNSYRISIVRMPQIRHILPNHQP